MVPAVDFRALHGEHREAPKKFLRSFFQKATAPRRSLQAPLILSLLNHNGRLLCSGAQANGCEIVILDIVQIKG